MNTRALQCFIKVYEKKSITSAAKDVYISPQGLSKIIKQLEAELETELFFRGTHGMEATETGELLYARARHLCYLMEDIKKEISIINGTRNALNVVVSYTALFSYSLDVLYRFSEEHPELQIVINDIPDTSPVEEMFQEQADVGVVLGHEGISNCDYELLLSGEVVLLVSPNHPLAGFSEISLKELENETFVIKSLVTGGGDSFSEKCLDAGFTPLIRHESENPVSVHHLCEKQNVIGVSIDFLEKSFPDKNLKILKLKKKIPRNIYYISKQREIQNKTVKTFLNYLKKQRIENS